MELLVTGGRPHLGAGVQRFVDEVVVQNGYY
jgi:hypothetical protein